MVDNSTVPGIGNHCRTGGSFAGAVRVGMAGAQRYGLIGDASGYGALDEVLGSRALGPRSH